MQVWKDKTCANGSTIHDATIVNKGSKDRKTNMEVKSLMLLSSTINS